MKSLAFFLVRKSKAYKKIVKKFKLSKKIFCFIKSLRNRKRKTIVGVFDCKEIVSVRKSLRNLKR